MNEYQRDHLEFAEEIAEILDEATNIFYRDSLTAQAHYKLGILAQFVHSEIKNLKEKSK